MHNIKMIPFCNTDLFIFIFIPLRITIGDGVFWLFSPSQFLFCEVKKSQKTPSPSALRANRRASSCCNSLSLWSVTSCVRNWISVTLCTFSCILKINIQDFYIMIFKCFFIYFSLSRFLQQLKFSLFFLCTINSSSCFKIKTLLHVLIIPVIAEKY